MRLVGASFMLTKAGGAFAGTELVLLPARVAWPTGLGRLTEMGPDIAVPNASLGEEIVRRVVELGTISEETDKLTRVFLSKELRTAGDLILAWMRDAGMRAHRDAIGNVCGRYEGDQPGLPCLMLGSHYDTVRDAGKWDGPLGSITAFSCVAELNRRGRRLPFAIEITG